MNKSGSAGYKGDKIRSDCFVQLELSNSGGIQIQLKSKVEVLYGNDIRKQIKDTLDFFDIKNASITIEDSGALPFVIAARIESCVRQVITTDKEFLLPIQSECLYQSNKERFRFSRLYLPGNSPSLMINAGLHKSNGIILDLEDSVAFEKKSEAQLLVRNALRQVDFYGAERMVRINQLPAGLNDLKYIVPHNVHLILIPKCENAAQIFAVEKEIEILKKQHNIKNNIFLMPIIESALGVEHAFEIASSSENIVALAIGLEDYTADLGVRRTSEGRESLYARTRLVNACKAAGIQAIDSVFSDVDDKEGLIANVNNSKSLGFEGMGCIHPRQVEIINRGFSPSPEETQKAKDIVKAYYEGIEKGLGVVSLGSKMIDAPIVKRALKTIDLAVSLGMISNNWREENETK